MLLEMTKDIPNIYAREDFGFLNGISVHLAPFVDKMKAVRLFGADIPVGVSGERMVRLAEIEVYPDRLEEYMTFATEVGRTSMAVEPGVISPLLHAEQGRPMQDLHPGNLC